MISTRQLSEALFGIWLVLKFDPRGFEYFDKTPGGFARSFVAAGILAPFEFAHSLAIHASAKTELALVPFVAVQMLAFVLGWVLFPFAMLYIGDLLNRRERYFWQMVPYNWVHLPIVMPLLIFALLMDMGAMSDQAFAFFYLMALTASFVYGIFIARVGLQVGYGTAVGVTVFDMILGLLMSQIIGLL